MGVKVVVVGRTIECASVAKQAFVKYGGLTACHMDGDENGQVRNMDECTASDLLVADPHTARTLFKTMPTTAFLLVLAQMTLPYPTYFPGDRPWHEQQLYPENTAYAAFRKDALEQRLIDGRHSDNVHPYIWSGEWTGCAEWKSSVDHVLGDRLAVLQLAAIMKACQNDLERCYASCVDAEIMALRLIKADEICIVRNLFGRPENSFPIAVTLLAISPGGEDTSVRLLTEYDIMPFVRFLEKRAKAGLPVPGFPRVSSRQQIEDIQRTITDDRRHWAALFCAGDIWGICSIEPDQKTPWPYIGGTYFLSDIHVLPGDDEKEWERVIRKEAERIALEFGARDCVWRHPFLQSTASVQPFSPKPW